MFQMDPDDELPFPEDDPYSSSEDSHLPECICDGCPGCITLCRYEPFPNEEAYFHLIHEMSDQILALEEEVVRWRQVLLKHLSPLDAVILNADLLSGLARRFYDSEVYQRYLHYCFDDQDPMESAEHVAKMIRLCNGTDETSIDFL